MDDYCLLGSAFDKAGICKALAQLYGIDRDHRLINDAVANFWS